MEDDLGWLCGLYGERIEFFGGWNHHGQQRLNFHANSVRLLPKCCACAPKYLRGILNFWFWLRTANVMHPVPWCHTIALQHLRDVLTLKCPTNLENDTRVSHMHLQGLRHLIHVVWGAWHSFKATDSPWIPWFYIWILRAFLYIIESIIV